MRRVLVYVLGAVLVISLVAGCGNSSSYTPPTSKAPGPAESGETYEKLRIKVSTSGTDLGVDSLAAVKFAELVKEASGGNIEVTVYPNCQLSGGSMPMNVELLAQGGHYEMAVLSASVLSNLDERFLSMSVPFTFANYEEVNEKLDGTGGEWLSRMLDSKGLVYLSGMHNGLKQITNSKREIRTPEDIRGLKIRIPGGEVGMMTFKAFGADPVAMSWSEVFTALQQGTIDGHENSYQTIDSANIYEVQKYLTEWNYSYDGYFFIANKKFWDGLNDRTKVLLQDKAVEAAQWGRDYLEDGEENLKKKFKDAGMVITELSAEELQAFVDVVKPVQEYFIDKFGAEACSAWGLEK